MTRLRWRRGAVPVAAVLGTVAALVGCTADPPPTPEAGPPGLRTALDRVGSTDGPVTISYGNTLVLEQLAGVDATTWISAVGSGAEALVQELPGPAALAILPEAAQYAVTVGTGDAALSLIAGGQSEQGVTQAAEEAGFDGSGTLVAGPDVADPVAPSVRQIRPIGADVVTGGADADLDRIDSDGVTLLDRPDLRALVDCLGDVVIAAIGPLDGALVAVGVRRGDTDVDSVICVGSDTAAATAATMAQAVEQAEFAPGRRYTTLFGAPQTAVLAGPVAQLTVTNTAQGPALTMLSMLRNGVLPGLG